MTGVRFAEVQARPAEFLNLTSLALEEFEVAPFEAAFQGRRGASMGNPEPLHRLLPAGNAGRSAVLPAHLPEDLRRSSGPGAQASPHFWGWERCILTYGILSIAQ